MDTATKLAFVCTAIGIGAGVWIITAVAPPPTPTTSSPTKTVSSSNDRLTRAQEDAFVKVVRENGYICNRVLGSRRLLSEVGITMHCENWTYDFSQKAGRWAITPRKLWGQ